MKNYLEKSITLNQGEAFLTNAHIWKIDENGDVSTGNPFMSGKFSTVGDAIEWCENNYPTDCAGYRLLVCINDDYEEVAVEHYFVK